jgi:hypothetical protein
MKLSPRHRLTLKKLVLPFVALLMMTSAMYMGSGAPPSSHLAR